MRMPLAFHVTPFAIGVATATVSVVTALATLGFVTLNPPPSTDPLPFLDRGWYQAISGGVLIPLAIWLRGRAQATAFALLAAACLLAGWGIESIRYDFEAPRGLVFVIRLLAGLVLVPATTAVVAAFATTPLRRLSRRMPVVLAVIVAISVIAVVGQTAIQESGGAYSGIGQSLVDWFSSPLVTLSVFALAFAGSVFNEAQRFVPAAAPRREATVPRPLGYAIIAALTVSVLAVGAGIQSDAAAQGQTMLPLLAALVAIVGARWSTYLGLAAVSVSLAIGAGIIFASAAEIEIRKIVEDPDATWLPTSSWLLMAAFALVAAGLGIAAASSALVEARRRRPAGAGQVAGQGAGGPWTLTGVAVGIAAWATASWLLWHDSLDAPLLEGPYWAMYMSIAVLSAVLVIGAVEAARARLVPAIAEAEATARRPLRPFRYLETIAIETLTGRASVRRSATAAERSKLASDLHAQILPSLAEIRSRYESGAPDAEVADRLRELEQDVRDLMAERRLVVLEEFGIVEAIEWLVGRAEERAAMDVQLSIDDRSTTLRPPREVERAAFRIAQLAVENALQHAAPSRLELQVLARDDEVRISVVDDGRGFTSPVSMRDRDHLGISDMRSQAAEVHGDVSVVSRATGGTMVTFAWPADMTGRAIQA